MNPLRVIVAALAAAAALTVAAPAALAGPREVVADYWADGQIDPSQYTTADLKAALKEPAVAAGGGVYDAFTDIVNAELQARLIGGADEPPRRPSAPPAKGGNGGTPGPGTSGQNETPVTTPLPADVPQPVAVDGDGSLPVAFMALAAVAGLLVVTGGGLALVRRLRRRY